MGGGLKQAHPCQPWLPWSTAQPLWRAATWPKARVEARGDRDEAAKPKQPGRRHRPNSSIKRKVSLISAAGSKRGSSQKIETGPWRADMYAVREKEVQTVTDLLTTGALDAEPARGARGCAP